LFFLFKLAYPKINKQKQLLLNLIGVSFKCSNKENDLSQNSVITISSILQRIYKLPKEVI